MMAVLVHVVPLVRPNSDINTATTAVFYCDSAANKDKYKCSNHKFISGSKREVS